MATRYDKASGPPGGIPELDLDVRPAPKPKAKPKRETEGEAALELAVDPGALVLERSDAASLVPARSEKSQAPSAMPRPRDAVFSDLESDARLLANCGDPPRHWLLSPIYAWRVLKNRRVLTAALVGRRFEAAAAERELENAIEAMGESARTTARKTATYARAIEELQRAEEVLKDREGLLAEERNAHQARLLLADERLSQLEAELAQAAAQRPADTKNDQAGDRKRLALARSERASLEQWLKRQGDARTAAVGDAREQVRGQMVALGRRAMSDREVFGGELDPAREQIARLHAAQQSAARDVTVHEAALAAHDGRSFRQGLIVTAILVLVLFVGPIVWRATRVVEPPTTHGMTGE